MEENEKKTPKRGPYLLAWLFVVALLIAVIFGIVHKLEGISDIPSITEPRDFTDTVDDKYTWDLSVMYKDMEAADAALKTLKADVDKLAEFKGVLGSSESFRTAITLYGKIMVEEEKIRIYANLMRDSDLENGEISDFLAEIEQLDSQIGDKLAFIKSELSKLSNQKLSSYAAMEEAALYKNVIDEIMYDRQSILSEREDRLLGLLNAVDQTYENNYQAFWNRFDFELKSEAYDDYYASDEKKRMNATRARLQKQIDGVELLASNLEGKIKYDNLIAKAYEYDSALEMVLSQDGISLKEYKAYEEATNKNLQLYHRWTRIKQKMLELDRPLRYYDQQLELVKGTMAYDYDQAVKDARAAFIPLGSEYLDRYDTAIRERWIDVYPRPGKYQGSYTWGAYASHPYILINYQNQLESGATFVHEIGHAIHNQFSSENQDFNHYENSIFKAEIASTANEVIFLEHQLKTQKGEMRTEALIEYVELITGTIFEQMKSSEFEKIIHEAQADGKDLDGNFLEETWKSLNAKYYGSSYEITDLDGYEWATIDHLYWNFYMYKYATGLAAGYSIAEKLIENPKETAPHYIAFLKTGSVDNTVEELKTLNVDLSSAEAMNRCYEKLSVLLSELEKEFTD